ncbi:hypothetical protein SBDP1_950030 [Syntrophobacter sp. SbD1]|nr:hypothetical protein SBDP1_950030 [Syntrophobacter sp. SbD1]
MAFFLNAVASRRIQMWGRLESPAEPDRDGLATTAASYGAGAERSSLRA